MEKLHLSGNRLEEVPASFGEMPNLGDLDLSSNNLGRNPALLRRLVKLKRLKKLNLADNRLEELPTSLGEIPNLEDLNLCCNNLETLPSSLGGLQTLKSLSLHGNEHLGFPEFLDQLPRLEKMTWGKTLWGPYGGSDTESCLTKLRKKGVEVELVWDKENEGQYITYSSD